MPDVEETRAEIRFALNQLSAQNRHHEFEHLARALARMTVSMNILPATGPVAAGGDQGRDFETYRTELPGQVQPLGRAMGIRETDGVGFCCSLQQDNITAKFADDVVAMLAGGTALSFIVAYCEVNVPTAARHRFQERMRTEHGIHVEVFDGNAIAELLTQRHTLWIAEQYLHLSARALPSSLERPEWYEEDLDRWRSDDSRLWSMGHLVDISGCLRYAMSHDDAAQDLPFWIGKMEQLLGDGVPSPVQQKAQYELAIAYWRGLGDMRPIDYLVSAFIDQALTSDEPSALRDADVLLLYCVGAKGRRRTNHTDDQIMAWNARLTERAGHLLDESPTPGQKCALLEVLAALKLHPDLDAIRASGLTYDLGLPPPRVSSAAELYEAMDRGDLQPLEVPLIDMPGALDALTRLVECLDQAPLFPVEGIADTLRIDAHLLVDDPRYDLTVTAIDRRIAAIQGGHAAGEAACDRAMIFLRNDRLLEALRELHRAGLSWFSGEASRELIFATLMTSEVYTRLRLYAAAKYYALVAAALVQRDDLVLYPRCLFKAAASDYHQGAWFAAAQLNLAAITAHAHLAERPFDPGQHTSLQYSLFEMSVIKAVADKAGQGYQQFIHEVLDEAGVAGFLRDFLATLPEPPWWESLTIEELGNRVLEDLGRPAFADAGARRSITWSALGPCWSIEFDNTYSDTLVGERLAAAAQIILADLALRDPVLLSTSVSIEVSAGPPGSEMELDARPSQHGPRWHVRLPVIDNPDREIYTTAGAELVGVVQAAVREISVLPEDQLGRILDQALEADLMSHVIFGIAFDVGYKGPIDAATFARAPRRECAPLRDDGRCPEPGNGLEFPTSPGPGYSVDLGRKQAQTRYEELPPLLQSTLPALREDIQFQETVRSLRIDGWLDWQILLAVFNLAKNVRLSPINRPRSAEEQRQLRARFLEPEPPNDPILPEVFTAERLNKYAEISLGSTAMNWWKLVLRQNPIDQVALRHLLVNRYMYGKDDAPHPDLFRA